MGKGDSWCGYILFFEMFRLQSPKYDGWPFTTRGYASEFPPRFRWYHDNYYCVAPVYYAVANMAFAVHFCSC